MLLTILVGAALPGGDDIDWTCYDPDDLCVGILCPCEGACRGSSDCPEGFLCRWDWSGPSSCTCSVGDGGPGWLRLIDAVGRCYPQERPTGPRGYTIVDVGPEDMSARCVAWNLNNHGQVVGISGNWRPFFWENGEMTELYLTELGNSGYIDINEHGQIVFSIGSASQSSGIHFMDAPDAEPVRISTNLPWETLEINNAGQVIIGADREDWQGKGEAVLWQDGVSIPMSYLSEPALWPGAINNLGHIAGAYGLSPAFHPAILAHDTLIEFEEGPVQNIDITGINDLDQVTYIRDIYDGLLWDNGTVVDVLSLMNPCYWSGKPERINNCGEMLLAVSATYPDNPGCEGLLPFPSSGYYSPQTGYRPLELMIDDAQRRQGIRVYDINDRGQIAGRGSVYVPELGQRVNRAFLASPVPGDFTMDGPIDLNDYARFFERFGLPTTDYSILCNRADFDEDADTDLHDFATFQTLFTGGQ